VPTATTFRVVSYTLPLSEPDCEEPGSDSMVEEKTVRNGSRAKSIARATSGVSTTVIPPRTCVFFLNRRF